MEKMQRILDHEEGLSFHPEINNTSRSLTRSIDSLFEWKHYKELKTERLRQISEESDCEIRKLSSKRHICPGSELIH